MLVECIISSEMVIIGNVGWVLWKQRFKWEKDMYSKYKDSTSKVTCKEIRIAYKQG